MRPTEHQLRSLGISERIFDRLTRWGWVDTAGRSRRWEEWQGPNHNDQFDEPKERKEKPKKFTKERQ